MHAVWCILYGGMVGVEPWGREGVQVESSWVLHFHRSHSVPSSLALVLGAAYTARQCITIIALYRHGRRPWRGFAVWLGLFLC